MANWVNPTITTQYDVFVAEMKDRDIDSATMFAAGSVPSIPYQAVRFNRTTKIFEEWLGANWAPLVIAVAGGGTGAASIPDVGTALGLGTMAYQNSNAVSISNGNALFNYIIFSGQVGPAQPHVISLGSAGYPFGKLYLSVGLQIPVGVDRYLVG